MGGHIAAPAPTGGRRARRAQERQGLRVWFDETALGVEGVDDGGTLTQAEYDWLHDVLLPDSAAFWGEALSVDRVEGPLFAYRPCQLAFSDGTCQQYADDDDVTCGADPESSPHIPPAYLGEQEACDGSAANPLRECETLPAGTGVEGADVVAFVTAEQTSLCGGDTGAGTVAYASWCQTDDVDRPTWGHINVCPNALKVHEEDRVAQVAVLLHELAHMFGFTSASMPLFRDADGDALTPRSGDPHDRYRVDEAFVMDVQCPGDPGGTRSTAVPSTSTTIDFSDARLHSACDPTDPGTCVVTLKTPALQATARKWFGCDDVLGIELEDNPAAPCVPVGSHWEQRYLMDELMSSTLTHKAVVSPLTLAYFEDTGWYSADYSMATPARQGFEFGYKQGCTFAEERCLSDEGSTGSPPHYCSSRSRDWCTVDRRAGGHCLLFDLDTPPPTMYRYFEDASKGNPSTDADHCPVVSAYSNRLCTDTRGLPNTNVVGETFGDTSYCFDSTAMWATASATGVVTGCYEVQCISETAAQVRLVDRDGNDQWVICDVDDGDVPGTVKTPRGFKGGVACLDVATLCGPAEIPTPDDVIVVPRTVFHERVSIDAGASGRGGANGGGDGGPTTSLVGQLVDATGLEPVVVAAIFGGIVVLAVAVACCYCYCRPKERVADASADVRGVGMHAAAPPREMSRADQMYYDQQASAFGGGGSR
uniref:Leishmanolysin-like peptidase n=1 Tax=Bicosoecida sp. CB-2014 TaxID=1486930 RepID=A0A7S1CD33_9STRA